MKKLSRKITALLLASTMLLPQGMMFADDSTEAEETTAITEDVIEEDTSAPDETSMEETTDEIEPAENDTVPEDGQEIILEAVPETTATPDETTAAEEETTAEPDETTTAEEEPDVPEIASGTCGPDLTWTLYEGGELVISGTGAMSNWSSYENIPWYSYRYQIETLTIEDGVTTIGEKAFEHCYSLTSVTIPDSVITIGEWAFYGCDNLTSVTIPDSVITIGEWAFYGCDNLTSVTIPDSVTTIENLVFAHCSNLTSVIIPNSITAIGSQSFAQCESLTSVSIGDSVTIIGYRAFSDCSSLTSVIIPDNVTTIGFETFYNCTNLTNVTIGDSVEYIGDETFAYCANMTDVTMGNNIEYIGDSAFAYCEKLTSITIPSSVTSIGGSAFSYCYALTKATIYSRNASFGTDVFGYVPSTFEINGYAGSTAETYASENSHAFVVLEEPEVPEEDRTEIASGKCGAKLTWVLYDDGELVISGAGAMSNWSSNSYVPWYNYKNEIKTLTIENGVTTIGYNAFANCTSLTSVTISDSVTYIGNSAFYWCRNMKTISIGNGVTSIGDSAFWECYNLTSVNISSIEAWCAIDFYNYYSNPLWQAGNLYLNGVLVENLIIPDSVTTISEYAFACCTSLTSVTMSDSITTVSDLAFFNCSGLTSVTIGDGVTSIGESTFANCSGLTSVIISDSVTEIGGNAFDGCSGLTSIDIPDSVTTIGPRVFYGCTGLTSVTIGDGVTFIGDSAFSNCVNLTNVTIGNSVTTISNSAFAFCSNLTSVTMGDSVAYIGSGAFAYCDCLTSINIPKSATTIGSSAFTHCYSLTDITIPDGVKTIGDSAFYYCSGITKATIYSRTAKFGSNVFGYTAEDFEINGYAGSTAETYASENGHAFVALEDDTFEDDSSFTDVAVDNIYYDAICDLTAKGIIVRASVFHPDAAITKIQTALYIAKACTGVVDSDYWQDGITPFIDVTDYTGAVYYVWANGIMDGYSATQFGPDDHVTYIQALKMAVTALGYTVESEYDWKWSTYNKAVNLGLTWGVDVNDLDKELTKAEFAQIIYNMIYARPADGDITLADKNFGSVGGDTGGDLTVDTIKNGTAKVDGAFDESYANAMILRNYGKDTDLNVLDSEWNGSAYADVYAMYDENYLYLFAHVVDDDLVSRGRAYATSDNNPIYNDCFEFYLVFNGDEEDQFKASIDAYGYDCFGLPNHYDIIDYSNFIYSVRTNQDSGTYDIEVAIPCTKGRLDLIKCGTLGLTCQINDINYDGITTHFSINKSEYPLDGLIVSNVIASGTCGDNLTWTLYKDGELVIDGTGDMWNYIDEAGQNGDESSSASTVAPWRKYSASIKSVTIKSGVTSIGEWAFYVSDNLTSASIGDSVTTIGAWAFRECYNLANVEFGDSVTTIDYGAFCGCLSLSDVTLPESVTTIGTNAFTACNSLTNVTIPDGVTTIGKEAFSSCLNLNSITIPASVTSMGEWVFAYSNALTNITVDPDNANYSSDESGVLFDKDKTILIQYPTGNEATTYSIPDSVSAISNNTFRYCNNLTDVTIPENVTTIGDYAFSDCDSLTSIDIPENATTIGDTAFFSCDSLATATIYSRTATFGKDVFANIADNFEIHGLSGSTSETYATENAHIFVAMDVEPEKFALAGVTMTLGSSLSLDFAIDTSKLVGVNNYAVMTIMYADGTTESVTVPQSEWTQFSGSIYTAKFIGMSAKQMNDVVTAVFYNSRGQQLTLEKSDSIQTYTIRMLNGSASTNAKLRRLYVDMLNYGTAAQAQFKYDQANLANRNLTSKQQTWATDNVYTANKRELGVGYVGSTLTLDSEIQLDIVFNNSAVGSNYSELYAIATYIDHYGVETQIRIDGSDFIKYGSSYCQVSITGMAVADFYSLVHCRVYNSYGEELAYAADSVESYINRNKTSLGNVAAGIMKFCASSYAYFHGQPSCAIEFDSNGGTAVDEIRTVAYGNTITELPIPTKENNTFLGWYAGGLLVTADTAIETLGILTLTAKWESDYKFIVFDSIVDGYPEAFYVDMWVDGEHQSSLPVSQVKNQVLADLNYVQVALLLSKQDWQANGVAWAVTNKNDAYQMIAPIAKNTAPEILSEYGLTKVDITTGKKGYITLDEADENTVFYHISSYGEPFYSEKGNNRIYVNSDTVVYTDADGIDAASTVFVFDSDFAVDIETPFVITSTPKQSYVEGCTTSGNAVNNPYIGIQELVNGVPSGDIIYIRAAQLGISAETVEDYFNRAVTLVNYDEETGTYDRAILGDAPVVVNCKNIVLNNAGTIITVDGTEYRLVTEFTGAVLRNEIVVYKEITEHYTTKGFLKDAEGNILDADGQIVATLVNTNTSSKYYVCDENGKKVMIDEKTALEKFGYVVINTDNYAPITAIDCNENYMATEAFELHLYDDDADGIYERALYLPTYISSYYTYTSSGKVYDHLVEDLMGTGDGTVLASDVTYSSDATLANGTVIAFTYNNQLNEVTVNEVIAPEVKTLKSIKYNSSTGLYTITFTDGCSYTMDASDVALGGALIERDYNSTAVQKLDALQSGKWLGMTNAADFIVTANIGEEYTFYAANDCIFFIESVIPPYYPYEYTVFSELVDLDLDEIYARMWVDGYLKSNLPVSHIFWNSRLQVISELNVVRFAQLIGDPDWQKPGTVYATQYVDGTYRLARQIEKTTPVATLNEFGLTVIDANTIGADNEINFLNGNTIYADGVSAATGATVEVPVDKILRTNADTVFYFLDEILDAAGNVTGYNVSVKRGAPSSTEFISVDANTVIYTDALGFPSATNNWAGVASVVFVFDAVDHTGFKKLTTEYRWLTTAGVAEDEYVTASMTYAEDLGLTGYEDGLKVYYYTGAHDLEDGSETIIYSTFKLTAGMIYKADKNGVVGVNANGEKIADDTLVSGVDYGTFEDFANENGILYNDVASRGFYAYFMNGKVYVELGEVEGDDKLPHYILIQGNVTDSDIPVTKLIAIDAADGTVYDNDDAAAVLNKDGDSNYGYKYVYWVGTRSEVNGVYTYDTVSFEDGVAVFIFAD